VIDDSHARVLPPAWIPDRMLRIAWCFSRRTAFSPAGRTQDQYMRTCRIQTRAHSIGCSYEDAHHNQQTTSDAIEVIGHAGSNILMRYRNGLVGYATL
jgi:hypothetical protein